MVVPMVEGKDGAGGGEKWSSKSSFLCVRSSVSELSVSCRRHSYLVIPSSTIRSPPPPPISCCRAEKKKGEARGAFKHGSGQRGILDGGGGCSGSRSLVYGRGGAENSADRSFGLWLCILARLLECRRGRLFAFLRNDAVANVYGRSGRIEKKRKTRYDARKENECRRGGKVH